MYTLYRGAEGSFATLAIAITIHDLMRQVRVAGYREWSPRMLRKPPSTEKGEDVEFEVHWADGRAVFFASKDQFAKWKGSQGGWEELVSVTPVSDPAYVPVWFDLPARTSVFFGWGGSTDELHNPDAPTPPLQHRVREEPSLWHEYAKWESMREGFRRHLHSNDARVWAGDRKRAVIFHNLSEQEQDDYVRRWVEANEPHHPDENWFRLQRFRTPVWHDEAAGKDPFDYSVLRDMKPEPLVTPPDSDGFVSSIPTLVVQGELDDGLKLVEEWGIPIGQCYVKEGGDGPQVCIRWGALPPEQMRTMGDKLFVREKDKDPVPWATWDAQQTVPVPAEPTPIEAAIQALFVTNDEGPVSLLEGEGDEDGGEITVYETMPPAPREKKRFVTARSKRRTRAETIKIDLWKLPSEMGKLVGDEIARRWSRKPKTIGFNWLRNRHNVMVVREKGSGGGFHESEIPVPEDVEQAWQTLGIDRVEIKVVGKKSMRWKADCSGYFAVERGSLHVLRVQADLKQSEKFSALRRSFMAEFRHVCGHEMTHARQCVEGWWHGNVSKAQSDRQPLLYFLDKTEVEAHVRSIVNLARSWGDTFAKQLSNIVKNFPARPLTPAEALRMRTVYTAWYNEHYDGWIEVMPKSKQRHASLGLTGW